MRVLLCVNHEAFLPSNEPYGFFRAVRALGHEAEVFFYRRKSFLYSNFRPAWVRWMNRTLAEKAKGFDLLFVHRGGFIESATIERIRRESRCRSVCFFPDNPFGSSTPPLPFGLIGAYDLFVAKDTYFEEELSTYGFRNVAALPHTYDPAGLEAEFTEEELAPFRADVAFIGGHYDFRERFFSGLTDEGVDFKLWGPRWTAARDPWVRRRIVLERPITAEEKAKVLRATRILVNLQHGGGAIYWPDDKVIQYIGAGACMAVNHKRDIGHIFEIGKEILTFRTREELQALVRRYLADEPARAEIARRGRERARREHTAEVRFRQILEILKERGIPAGG